MDIKSLSKKISYHNIRYKLKRLIFKMGENDFYPQLPKSKYSFLTNYQRYKFWNSLARKHKQFKYFYQKNPGEYFEKYLPISKNHKYYVNFKKFYEDGVAEIENFFNNEEHQLILNFFKSNTIKNLESVKKQNVICKDENINQLIFNKTKILEKILFGKYFKKQNYNFQSILKNKNESSIFGTSANFHPDRFIPSIKLIYFPTDVKIDPFEYALGSHIINENFKQNILIEFENEKKIGKLIREQIKLNRETGQNMDPKLLDETTQNQYNFNFKSYRVKKFYSKANTLLIVATHGLHRRSQTFEKDNYGIRNNLTISYYNEFTRLDLLKKLYN